MIHGLPSSGRDTRTRSSSASIRSRRQSRAPVRSRLRHSVHDPLHDGWVCRGPVERSALVCGCSGWSGRDCSGAGSLAARQDGTEIVIHKVSRKHMAEVLVSLTRTCCRDIVVERAYGHHRADNAYWLIRFHCRLWALAEQAKLLREGAPPLSVALRLNEIVNRSQYGPTDHLARSRGAWPRRMG